MKIPRVAYVIYSVKFVVEVYCKFWTIDSATRDGNIGYSCAIELFSCLKNNVLFVCSSHWRFNKHTYIDVYYMFMPQLHTHGAQLDCEAMPRCLNSQFHQQ
jgi:hypothetical protein